MLKAPPYDAQPDAHATEGRPANGEGAERLRRDHASGCGARKPGLILHGAGAAAGGTPELCPSVDLPSLRARGGPILNDAAAAAADAEADAELRRSMMVRMLDQTTPIEIDST